MTRGITSRIVLAAALLGAPVLLVGQQTGQQDTPPRQYSAAQAGTAQLGGVVLTTAGTDQPIRRAIVRITAPELRGSREIATDDAGRFVFADLPAGRYQLYVSKPGYVGMSYGQKLARGSGTSISLADGQRELGLRVQLPKGAVVTGRVTDEFGQPIPHARIEISGKSTFNGQTTLVTINSNNAMTDDRGMYRLYGLPAGTFIVAVSSLQSAREGVLAPTSAAEIAWVMRQTAAPAGTAGYSSAPPERQTVAFTKVFHPSAIRATDATPFDVEAGAERAGIDITVRFVPVARVTGAVTMPDGAPASGATVILLAESDAGESAGQSMDNSRTSPAGAFEFSSAKSGRYKVMVQASSRAAGGRGGGPLDLWGMTNVSVDGRDVSGVTVVLQPGMTFGGRIVIDPAATTKAPDLATTRVTLAPAQRNVAAFGVAPATIAPDGTFTMAGAAPGSYRMNISPPLSPNTMGASYVWVAKSVTVRGREVLERAFDVNPGENIDGAVITLTDRVTSLSGRLIDGQGKPAPDYSVVVFAVDRAFWVQGLLGGPRQTRPASDGSFRFQALPPGEYHLAVATDVNTRDLYPDAFLEQLIPTAIKLTIAEGEKKVQDLKVAR